MPQIVTVSDMRTRSKNGCTELVADVRGLSNDQSAQELWFRFGPEFKGKLTNVYDPFVLALAPAAMRKGGLQVDGDVSSLLLSGVRQAITIWSRWFKYDHMHAVEVEARNEVDTRVTGDRIACLFTGGADSFYTLLKNVNAAPAPDKIDDLLYVRGFDVRLDDVALYEDVRSHLEAIAEHYGLGLILPTSNLRDLVEHHVNWLRCFGAATIGTALCMSPEYRRLLVPATHPYSAAKPEASHPGVDPLFSNGATQIVHDGAEASRSQKFAWQIAKSDVALEHLRVCIYNPGSAYNCGVCAKCVRTKLNLLAAGAIDLCKTLSSPPTPDMLTRRGAGHPDNKLFLADNLEALRRLGTVPALVRTLEIEVRRARAMDLVRKVMRPVDHYLLGGSAKRAYRALRRSHEHR